MTDSAFSMALTADEVVAAFEVGVVVDVVEVVVTVVVVVEVVVVVVD